MVKVKILYAILRFTYDKILEVGMLDQERDTLSRLLTLIDAKYSPEKL